VRNLLRLIATISLLGGTFILGTGAAGAAVAGDHRGDHNGDHDRRATCTGTFTAPGVLTGTYKGDVVVTGVCFVNAGAAVVKGDLILAPGAALNATFALNDVAGSGTSSLTVKGDVKVGPGALLAMGCEPNFSPCSDDPNAGTGGTLTGQNKVYGDVKAFDALGVLVHASTIKGSVRVRGGGGGLSCNPPFPGAFAEIGSPPFSDFEDNTIGGNLSVTDLTSCWLGALRNSVRRSVFIANNTMGDPDAMEILANHIRGSIACYDNSPAVQYGDSGSSPNLVRRHASGQCGFNVLQPNPAPDGTPTPISVKSKHS
jgi:hypothetical protein